MTAPAWKCQDCGYEDEERWLTCPECSYEDRAEALAGATNCARGCYPVAKVWP